MPAGHARRRAARRRPGRRSFRGSDLSADRGEIPRRRAGGRRAWGSGAFHPHHLGTRHPPGALQDPGGRAIEARRLCFNLPRHPIGEIEAVLLLSTAALRHLGLFLDAPLPYQWPEIAFPFRAGRVGAMHPQRSNDRTKCGLPGWRGLTWKVPTTLAAPGLRWRPERRAALRPYFVKRDRSTESAIFW